MAAIVSSGATLTLSAGQTSNAVTVLPGGTLDILSGGIVTSALVLGYDVVLGGQDSLGTVGSGGTRTASSGGTVVGGTVSSGGTQIILAGGFALGATILPGGHQTVSSGGVASGAAVYGTETVSSGGIASGSFVGSTTISNFTIFGDEDILGGGEALSVTVGNGGDFIVSGLRSSGTDPASASVVTAPGIASGTIVQAGGTVDVYDGGVTAGTVLLAPGAGFVRGFAGGASDNVFTGGTANGTIVNSGAGQGLDGGSTSGTVVLSGGAQGIYSGTALNDAVASGGYVLDQATLAFTEAAGATTPFLGTLSGSGLLIQSGPGTLALAGALGGFTGSVLISGGTLELTSAASVGSATVAFALGAAGTLRIDGTAGPANTISSFKNGDTIDLAGLAFSGTATPTVNGNIVAVTEGGVTETLILAGAANARFALAADGAVGTQLTDTAPSGIVSAGQVQSITAGQTSQGLGILAGGVLDVLAGGTATGTTVLGVEAILGGTESAGFVSSGGAQTVLSGGLAIGTLVAAGGLQTISAGGAASGTLVNGSAAVLSGGALTGSIVSGAGTLGPLIAVETVSGGQSMSAAVGSGGELIVAGMLSADGSTVAASGTANATTVSAGGVLLVGVGGVASGTVLFGPTPINASAGLETISGGIADGTVVGSGGTQTLEAGTTSGTRVLSGGNQVISGGTALNDQLLSGGVVTIGSVLAFTEASGTTSTFAGAVYGNGILLQSGPGTLALALSGTFGRFVGSAAISGGTLELTNAGALASATIAFAPAAAGMLRIDGAVGPTNTISGLAAGDVIDLTGLRHAGTAAPTVNGNTVTVRRVGRPRR